MDRAELGVRLFILIQQRTDVQTWRRTYVVVPVMILGMIPDKIHTHPYTTAACAAGVVTKTTDDKDSLRYTYNGIRRVRQLALGCESNGVKSTHDAYENTWKCGELQLYFSLSAGG